MEKQDTISKKTEKGFRLFRCRICGDPYLGDEAPSKCPFCGAKHTYMIDAKDYKDPFAAGTEFTPKEMENFKKALDLEIGNASFYAKASKTSSDEFHRGMFKALMKVESEHASIFSKHLGIQKPSLDESIIADSDGHTNLLESHRREDLAIKSYSQFLRDAETLRAKQVFFALVEIESDHLGLED